MGRDNAEMRLAAGSKYFGRPETSGQRPGQTVITVRGSADDIPVTVNGKLNTRDALGS